MAPTHAAVAVSPVVAVESVDLDAALIRQAAALLVRIQPCKKSKKVICELRSRLEKEQFERESHGLNHWDKHAPKFLADIVRQARVDRLRRYRDAEAFYKAAHTRLVRVAQLIVGDASAAEIVASETYRELLTGSATVAGAFTALICNARNYLEADAYRTGKLAPLDEAFVVACGNGDYGDDEDALMLEPVSGQLEELDPLDILIAREEEQERRRMVATAQEDPRWRYIKRREWAAPLLGNVRN